MLRLASVALTMFGLVSSAGAATIPGATIDGPSGEIVLIGGFDVAPDGNAAVAYVKKDGGVDHAFIARFDGTTWGPPTRVDAGVTAAASGVSVAVAAGGRTVVTFASGAPLNRANSAIAPATGQPFQLVPVTGAGTDLGVRVDMNDGGIAYAAVTSGPAANRDVGAYRLSGTTWTQVRTDDATPTAVLDTIATNDSGDTGSQGRPDIGVTPDGNAAIAFVESPTSGETHITVRRIDGIVARAARRADDLTSLGPAPAVAATTNDMVSLDVASNTRAWVGFRQSFTYGATNRPRIIVRPLEGASLGAPQNPDGLGDAPTEGAEFPDIDINSSGLGLLATPRQLTGEAWSATLATDVWTSAGRIDATPASASPPRPVAGIGDDGTGVIAWTQSPGITGTSEVRARVRLAGGAFGAPVTLSDTALGSVAFGDPPVAVGVDRAGRGMIAWAQGAPGALRIVVARTDGPPPAPTPPSPPAAPTPPAPPIATPLPAVRLTNLSITPRSFRAKASGAQIVPTGGARVEFELDRSSLVTLWIERPAPGRRVGTNCFVPTKNNRGAKSCRRWVRVASPLQISGANGTNRLQISGRANGKRLAPGNYRLALRPQGAVVRRAFTVRP